jgi:L-rhamnose isomerase
MNRILATTLLVASAALAGHAFADDITPSDNFVSSADRAEVQAGVAQARTTANPWSTAYNPLAGFRSGRTRAEVRAEYIASRDEVAALTAEDGGAFALAQQRQVDAQLAGVRGEGAVE